MKNYIKKTWKNKLFAIILVLIGSYTLKFDTDGTGFLFVLIFAIPLFFATENFIDTPPDDR